MRIVKFRIGGTDEAPELRDAFIVREWPGNVLNLAVIVDGYNDSHKPGLAGCDTSPHVPMVWVTSCSEGFGVRQWHDYNTGSGLGPVETEPVPAEPTAEPVP